MGAVLSKLRAAGGANVWFAVSAAAALASVPLYALWPDGAIRHFGGTPTPTSRFWVQAVAAGDALCGAMCLQALLSPRGGEKASLARLVGLYNLAHMAAFLHGHHHHERHPGGAGPYVASLIVGTAAAAWFGWARPPADE